MAWVKLDDQAPRHAKMLKAGPAACWLWVCGIAHSQSQLTDGFVSLDALPMIGVKQAEQLAERLADAGLWERVPNGYRIVIEHEYPLFAYSRPRLTDSIRLQLRRLRYRARRFLPDLLKDSGGRCMYCGCEDGPFEVDHIVPLSRGGTNDRANLAAACRGCNNKKGDRLI